MLRKDVVYALIYNEDREEILMVNNQGSSWSLPGGAVEKGEISIQDENEILGIEWVGIQRVDELMPYRPMGVQKLLQHSSIYTFQG